MGRAPHRRASKPSSEAAPGALLLVAVDNRVGQADFGDHAPKIRVWVPELVLNDVDDVAVVQSNAGEMLVDFDVDQAWDEAMVSRPDPKHQPALLAGPPNAENHGQPLLPPGDHLGE